MKERKVKRFRIFSISEQAGFHALARQACENQGDRYSSEFDIELTPCTFIDDAVDMFRQAMGKTEPFAVVLIEAGGPDGSAGELGGIQIGAQLRNLDPHVNFIIITETPAENLNTINTHMPPQEKVLFLQKPVQQQVLRQSVLALGAMWRSGKELQRANAELNEVNLQLMETNDALSVLARNLDATRRESEKRIVQRTRTLIIPIIEKLQYEKNLKKYRIEFDLLVDYIGNLTSDLANDIKVATALSAAELRVASMIKNGMSSEDIAEHLNLSVFTIKTHRKNIRKKLKLKNSGVNLKSYLESEMTGG